MMENEFEKTYDEKVIERGEEYIDNVVTCIKVGNFLFAEVHGSTAYQTKVDLTTFQGDCSCPYQHNCKHAVAAYLYFKKGKSIDADGFLKGLESLDKKELIRIITAFLPEKPELAANYVFREKTDFDAFVEDFTEDFSPRKLEQMEDNLDCLTFEQLVKVLDYVSKNEDSINDTLSENQCNSYDYYDEEEDVLGDFEYKIKEELIKRTTSQEQLTAILKKGYMNEELADDAERFFNFKETIKKYFGKEQYLRFLLRCKNPDLREIKENATKSARHHILDVPNYNIALAEKLAEYLGDDDLRFITAYHKDDANGIIKYFDNFVALKRQYLVQPTHIVKILSKNKDVPEEISKQLFSKEYFESYPPQHIRFLVNNIKDREFILRNVRLNAEFSKLKEVIRRLGELGYDTKLLFNKKELLDGRHWTGIVEILNFSRHSFGDDFVAALIKFHKDRFTTSSALKHNLKKEGIYITSGREKFVVELK